MIVLIKNMEKTWVVFNNVIYDDQVIQLLIVIMYLLYYKS